MCSPGDKSCASSINLAWARQRISKSFGEQGSNQYALEACCSSVWKVRVDDKDGSVGSRPSDRVGLVVLVVLVVQSDAHRILEPAIRRAWSSPPSHTRIATLLFRRVPVRDVDEQADPRTGKAQTDLGAGERGRPSRLVVPGLDSERLGVRHGRQRGQFAGERLAKRHDDPRRVRAQPLQVGRGKGQLCMQRLCNSLYSSDSPSPTRSRWG